MWMGVSPIMLMIMLTIFMSLRMITGTGRPFLLSIHPNIHFGRRNPAPIHTRNLKPCPKVQLRHSLLQQLRRHARIDQGA